MAQRLVLPSGRHQIELLSRISPQSILLTGLWINQFMVTVRMVEWINAFWITDSRAD
jgi:hypothetical protein